MANFKELNNNINIVLQKILSNQNLCKLLYYSDTDALSKEDFEEVDELLYTKIFPYPRSTETLDEASSLLMVGFNNFKPVGTNNFVNMYLYFRILCHETLWKVDEGLRPYLIAHEVANLFNNQRTIGIGKTLFYSGGEILTKNYSGFELIYKVTDFS